MSHYSGSVPETERPLNWRAQAACRGEDPELFFALETTAQGKADTRHAQVICYGCPVLQDCGQWALETREPFGVFGGMTEGERRAILRRRGVRLIADPDRGNAEPEPRNKGGRPRAACGTPSAYDRHVKLGEPIDDACRAAHARASAERKARAKQPAKCGTRPGYQKHLREKTEICQPCRDANTAADRRLRNTGTTKQAAA